MTPIRPARPSLLAAAGIVAVAGALAVTGAASPAGRGGARRSPGSRAWQRRHGCGGAPTARADPARGHPALGTRASCGGDRGAAGPGAAVLDGGADGRSEAARPARADPAHRAGRRGDHSTCPPPCRAARTQARPDAATVLMSTATAAWPGGGAVAAATGKVFFTMDGQDYVCSGAVVASANADVVITAGHCAKNGMGSWAVNWTFVPGFTEGSRPYGSWTAHHFFVARQWTHAANDNDDVAFVTLNPQVSGGRIAAHRAWSAAHCRSRSSSGPRKSSLSGTRPNPLMTAEGCSIAAAVSRPTPSTRARTRACAAELTAGSSGGPWLSGFDPVTGRGTITSVSSFKYSTDPSTLYGAAAGRGRAGPVRQGAAQIKPGAPASAAVPHGGSRYGSCVAWVPGPRADRPAALAGTDVVMHLPLVHMLGCDG